jgi:hypothetical protein
MDDLLQDVLNARLEFVGLGHNGVNQGIIEDRILNLDE